jgi:hypothetical protein
MARSAELAQENGANIKQNRQKEKHLGATALETENPTS